MRLNQLIEATPGLGWSVLPGSGDPASIDISWVTDDSRRVRPGALFVARQGVAGDGSRFIEDAIARGAVAIVCAPAVAWRAAPDAALLVARAASCAAAPASGAAVAEVAPPAGRGSPSAPPPIVRATVRDPVRAVGLLAHALEGWPTRLLRVAGVTGTNGKTTVTFLLRQLLQCAGRRCGLMGTVEVNDGTRSVPATLTTPGADDVARALGAMVRNGCDCAAIEISSHALDQSRVEGVDLAVGIFTNLSGDHLDYHGSMEAYARAKARLFERLPSEATAIVNAMDPWHERMVRDCRARVLRCRMAVGGGDPCGATQLGAGDFSAGTGGAGREPAGSLGEPAAAPTCGGAGMGVDSAIGHVLGSSRAGMQVAFEGPWGRFEAWLPLPGAHNGMNALQAIVAAHLLGVPAEALERALPSLAAPPGRLQSVTSPGSPFQVFVDYAHTDDALRNVLGAIRPLVGADGRSIVVFGCGGDRDRTKRPRMAAVACRLADLVFVTSDNPRSEDPESIIDEIISGVPERDLSRVQRDGDRARAIRAAIDCARPGDVVLIAGKGHEKYQEINGQRRHFDDCEVAREALASLKVAAGGAA